MDFFKVKRFRLCLKSKSDESTDSENIGKTVEGELEESVDPGSKESDPNGGLEEEEEEDDDEEETSSSEWRESDIEDAYHWPGFTSLHSCYCERMLFFDKTILQHLEEAGTDSWNISNRSPKIATKKLALSFKSLSFKRQEEIQGDREQLNPSLEDEPFHSLENAYVAQLCLSWEALHCQYVQLSQQIPSHPENLVSYGHSAQEFQQFQVLLQRFIENEPFEQGSRPDIYARARSSLPKLLQVPTVQGSDHKENDNEDVDSPMLAQQLLNLMEVSILTFRCFLKRDKSKANNLSNLINGHDAITLHQVQTSLAMKEAKLKELSKKKGWKNSWPVTPSEAELLLALIDVQVVQRVLRMARISKEKLLWCEEKVSKLDLSGNKLVRNGSPILFPR
ncbi:hypothetical protein KSP39_PZI023989 [Platanthera zijinensis]|uniref:Uncharacterized protein n=1 Tax=Platanthera zijinensis TaxID=2320716 RepID=A0AAP0FU61_9ASPA